MQVVYTQPRTNVSLCQESHQKPGVKTDDSNHPWTPADSFTHSQLSPSPYLGSDYFNLHYFHGVCEFVLWGTKESCIWLGRKYQWLRKLGGSRSLGTEVETGGLNPSQSKVKGVAETEAKSPSFQLPANSLQKQGLGSSLSCPFLLCGLQPRALIKKLQTLCGQPWRALSGM